MHTRFKNSILLISPLKVLICMKMCAPKKYRKKISEKILLLKLPLF